MRTRDLGHRHRARPARAPQRHHGRRRRPRRPRHDHRRRRAAGRRPGPGPDRGHGRRPARPGRLARAGLRRLPPAQRQRRADRPRVGPRIGDADDARSRSPTRTASASSATRWSPASVEHARSAGAPWSLPVVGETYDGLLNDINGFHVRAEHLRAALDAASGGPVAEGNVGGGTGMVCHEFKGGIGTASRVIPAERGGYTVGVLVQANYGKRAWLRVDGVPVGAEIGRRRGPEPVRRRPRATRPRTRRPARARSSSSSRPTRRCSPTSASASPSGPGSASRGPAGRAGTRAATCSSPSRPATGCPPRTRISPSSLDLRRPGGRRRRHRRAVRRDHRGDRGGDHQRPGRRRDDDRARRHHRPRPAPRPAARGHGPLRARTSSDRTPRLPSAVRAPGEPPDALSRR